MQQIFIIHGGDAFDTREEFLAYLKKKTLTLERIRSGFFGWKETLGKKLGKKFEVFNPKMPNPSNARYVEWKIWFKKMAPLMNSNVILIGHSLGGIFLAKYLSEEKFPVKIRATILVGAPFNTATDHPLVDFNLSGNLKKFEKQGGIIYLFHSKDDKIVPYSNMKAYQKALPTATVRSFENRGHFIEEKFPEIVKEIRLCR